MTIHRIFVDFSVDTVGDINKEKSLAKTSLKTWLDGTFDRVISYYPIEYLGVFKDPETNTYKSVFSTIVSISPRLSILREKPGIVNYQFNIPFSEASEASEASETSILADVLQEANGEANGEAKDESI